MSEPLSVWKLYGDRIGWRPMAITNWIICSNYLWSAPFTVLHDEDDESHLILIYHMCRSRCKQRQILFNAWLVVAVIVDVVLGPSANWFYRCRPIILSLACELNCLTLVLVRCGMWRLPDRMREKERKRGHHNNNSHNHNWELIIQFVFLSKLNEFVVLSPSLCVGARVRLLLHAFIHLSLCQMRKFNSVIGAWNDSARNVVVKFRNGKAFRTDSIYVKMNKCKSPGMGLKCSLVKLVNGHSSSFSFF